MLDTAEQTEIITSIPNIKDCLQINAFAGTGKTTTLIKIAERYPDRKFLYLAFNKAIAEEAKRRFPSNVDAKTTHSLAYSKIARGERARGEYRVKEIADILHIDFITALTVSKIVQGFCNSAYPNFNSLGRGLLEEGMKNPALYINHAQNFYELMRKRSIQITHSFYLKEFQLMNGAAKYRYDYVMLDEGQDTNPVTLSIFYAFKSRKIIVGDTHQQIYSFRGSIDAMEQVKSDITLYLSQTFRCVPEITKIANYILRRFKGETISMVSMTTPSKNINTKAHLSRTNASLIELVDLYNEFNLTRNPDEIFKSSLSVFYYKTMQFSRISPDYKFLTQFTSYDEFEAYLKDTEDAELTKAAEIVATYQDRIEVLYAKAVRCNTTYSPLTLTTAHSAKGLEFDEVELEPDFPNLEEVQADSKMSKTDKNNEFNLMYVAVTRAKYSLINKTENVFPGA